MNAVLVVSGGLVGAAVVFGVVLACVAACMGDDPEPTPVREPWPLTEHERAVQHECGELLQALTREGRTILARDRARGTA